MKKEINKYLTNGNLHIILLVFLIPAFFIRYFIANAQIITNDGLLYIKIAKSISSGNLQCVADYGFFNLYSFLIALFQIALHDWEFSGKMVSVVFGALTIIPLFSLTKRLFNQNVAIVSALLYCIHPRFVEYSSDVLREPVFWFFSVTALWLTWEGISRKKYFPFVLSSLATGFAIFTRLEGALVFFVVILWILWFFFSDNKNRKKYFLYALIFIISLPILASPGLVILKNKLNRWEAGLSIDKIPQLIYGNNQQLELEKEFYRDVSGKSQAFYNLSSRHRYTTFLAEVLYKFFKSSNIVLFLLFIGGIYKRRFIPYSQKDIIVLIWFSLAFLGSYLYAAKTYYLGTRHGLLMVLPAIVWAGVGFYEIRERLRKRLGDMKLFQRYARFDTTILIVLILVTLVPQTVFSYRYDKIELKKAGIELKEMGFSNTTIIVQPTLIRVAFYADSEAIQLPVNAEEKVLITFLEEHKNRILLIDDRTIDLYTPSVMKIIINNRFEKLPLPSDQYKNYSFSIYRIR